MTYTQFISQNSLKNVYILYGDSFLANKCVEFVKEKTQIVSEYDISKFDSENFSAGGVITSCEQISFFNNFRMVIVKNLSSITESDKKSLLGYVQNVNPSCILLFVDTLKSGIFDFLKQEKVELALNDYEIRDFVKEQLNIKGKTASNETIMMLINFCQKDMQKINLEMQKLVCYLGERTEITIDDIKLLVPQTEELVVFELTTALGEKNVQKSLNILYKLMGNQEQNSKLFSLLSMTLRRMFFCAVSKNLSDSELATKFNVKEFAVKKLKQQAKSFAVTKLKNILYELCEVEYMLKNGQMSQENALYYMVMFITL